ncbi:MAG: DNA polymerase III subunit gamma/tau [Clostridia bacterium]|nr:DNA polymerase III subunit gamma/tau [Clostridia bacterium]
MEYTALYRKYRPRVFNALAGQEHIATTLLNGLKQERVAHAYLFCGPRGTGKTSAALILARAVNCLNSVNGEPCGECESCKRILLGNSLDILEIDAASNRGIDEMRDLRERVKYTPAQEKYKVYIIDEVHMLTNESFNALLKTLEEPPSHVIFVLATTEPHKVPVTVLSRCQRFDFHRIGQEVITSHLKSIAEKEKVKAEEAALNLIARRSEGGLRDALSLLDQAMVYGDNLITVHTVAEVLGTVDEDFVAALAKALAKGNALKIIQDVDVLVSEGRDLRQFLHQLLEYLRQELLLSLTGDKAEISRRRLLQMLRDLVDADQRLRYSLTPRLTLEIALLGAARLEDEASPAKPALQKGKKSSLKQLPKKASSLPKQEIKKAVTACEPSLKDISESWPDILQIIRKKSPVTHAFLREGKVAGYTGDVLTIGYAPAWKAHMQKVMEDNHRTIAEEALAQVLGREVKLKTQTLEE